MRRVIVFCGALLLCLPLVAQEEGERRASESITVTATKVPEDITIVPAAITVISGDDLRVRSATDLASALSSVGGVAVAMGGDGGPAGSVPEMWGLREFDAFLLVVDGVPWGGAFNPDLPTLDMNNIDRIEVVRGAAPVMFGATAFVGVIHVIHREAGTPGHARLSAGSYRTGEVSATVPISQATAFAQSITTTFDRHGFEDDDTSYVRGHVLYRMTRPLGKGMLKMDADGSILRQNPASPHLREGSALSLRTPLDANYNPGDARLDHNRVQGTIRWEGPAFGMPTAMTLSVAHSNVKTNRGFLTSISGDSIRASGYVQDRDVDDLYFDAHVLKVYSESFRVIAGIDHLFGRGEATSALFDYTMALGGGSAPSSGNVPRIGDNAFRETRNFSGAYAAAEWNVSAKLRVDAGARLNSTRQHRTVEHESDRRSSTRVSGSAGATYVLYNDNKNRLAAFTSYRNTFKPAAVDFGPVAAVGLLRPEDAQSFELGLKGAAGDGRLLWQAAAFDLDFSNLVVSTIRNGLPALENGGKTRFRGVDFDVDYLLTGELRAELGYSYHDARFGDFVQSFDGVPTQLRGKRFEMSPFHLAGATLLFAPEEGTSGLTAQLAINYAGSRFLNKRNTAFAPGYMAWSAGVGYRFGRSEIRLDGRNLGNTRPPVTESELGDAQYYLLPARTIDLTYRFDF